MKSLDTSNTQSVSGQTSMASITSWKEKCKSDSRPVTGSYHHSRSSVDRRDKIKYSSLEVKNGNEEH